MCRQTRNRRASVYLSCDEIPREGVIPPAFGKLNKLKVVNMDWNPLGGEESPNLSRDKVSTTSSLHSVCYARFHAICEQCVLRS